MSIAGCNRFAAAALRVIDAVRGPPAKLGFIFFLVRELSWNWACLSFATCLYCLMLGGRVPAWKFTNATVASLLRLFLVRSEFTHLKDHENVQLVPPNPRVLTQVPFAPSVPHIGAAVTFFL